MFKLLFMIVYLSKAQRQTSLSPSHTGLIRFTRRHDNASIISVHEKPCLRDSARERMINESESSQANQKSKQNKHNNNLKPQPFRFQLWVNNNRQSFVFLAPSFQKRFKTLRKKGGATDSKIPVWTNNLFGSRKGAVPWCRSLFSLLYAHMMLVKGTELERWVQEEEQPLRTLSFRRPLFSTKWFKLSSINSLN